MNGANVHKPGSDEDACEHATFHRCLCHECSGTLHKWKGLLELAGHRPADPTGSGRELWVNRRVAAWEKRVAMLSKQRSVVAKRQSALERATPRGVTGKTVALARSENRLRITLRASAEKASDYVESLLVRSLVGSERRSQRDQIEELLIVHQPVRDALRATAGVSAADNDAFMSGIASSHLWCGLLAAEARDLQLEGLDARSAASSFFATPEGNSFDNIDALLDAVAAAWREREVAILRLFDSQDELTSSARIAAMFICPAPEAHDFLLERAVLPIVDRYANDELIQEVRPSLKAN